MSLIRRNQLAGTIRAVQDIAAAAMGLTPPIAIEDLRSGTFPCIVDKATPFGNGALCSGKLSSNGKMADIAFENVLCEAELEYGSPATLVLGEGDQPHLVAGGVTTGSAAAGTINNTYYFGQGFGSEA